MKQLHDESFWGNNGLFSDGGLAPTVVLRRKCHGDAGADRQRRRLSSWKLALRVQDGWTCSTTWVLAFEGT